MVSSTAPALQSSAPLFPYHKWGRALPALARQYRDNYPCPHIRLIDFLECETASAMADEFPQPSSQEWTQYKHVNENKLGMAHRELFPPTLGAVTDELNSPEFVAWLSELTGIPNLIADPMLEGGGLHQSGRGGYLNVHTDFSMHHFHTSWPASEFDSLFESGLACRVGRMAGIVGTPGWLVAARNIRRF